MTQMRKWQKHVNENYNDVAKDEKFVCKYCGKRWGNNSSNLKAHKKDCKHGKVDKLPLMVFECDSCKCKFSNRFNLHQHIASSPCCKTRIEQLQKGKSNMASDKKTKKQTVLVIVWNLPQDIIMGQVSRNLHVAEQLKLKRLKSVLGFSQKLRVHY